MKRYQKNRQRKARSAEFAEYSYETVIDGKEEKCILAWANQLINTCLAARDKMIPSKVTNSIRQTSNNFVERAKRDYDYYHDLKSRLYGECDLDTDTPVVNWLQQRMRTKFGILASNMLGFEYERIGEEDAEFVNSLNQVLRIKLREQGYPDAMMDVIAQATSFGTSHIGLFHTFTEGEPEGLQYFETLDPLGVLVNFGALHINGYSSKRAKSLIIVRMRPKGKIEREYKTKIEDDNPQAFLSDIRKFNIMYSVAGDTFTRQDDMIPEIIILHDDETTEDVIEEAPKMTPVIIKDTNEVLLDNDGKVVYDNVVDPESGEYVFEKKKTGYIRMKYPKGRVIVISGRQILFDGNNPYKHGLRPLVKINNTWDFVNYWGLSDVDIGSNTQQAITKLDRDIFRNIENLVGILGISQFGLVDPEQPILREEGLRTMRLTRDVGSAGINAVLRFFQANAFTQDQYLYRQRLVEELGHMIGTPAPSIGKAYAADSGVKFEAQYQVAKEFHNPLVMKQVLAIHELAKMWICNESQFNIDERTFAIINKKGEHAAFEYSGRMEEMSKDYPVEVRIYHLSPTGREQEMAEMIKLKELVPELPNDLILRLSRIPEVVEYARMEQANRAGLYSLLQNIDEAGFSEIMEKMAKESGGNGKKSAA